MSIDVRALGHGQARFVGFKPHNVDLSLATVDLRLDQAPAIMRLRDVVIFPKLDAVYGVDGRRIEQSVSTWMDPSIPPPADQKAGMEDDEAPLVMAIPPGIKRSSRPVAFLGRRYHHYGHLVTDGLARCWALPQIPHGMPVVLAQLRAEDLAKEPARTLFNALGVGPARLRPVDQPTLFTDVVLPLPALQRGRGLWGGFDAPHNRIARRLTWLYRNPGLDRPIYLTRSRLTGATRAMAGEVELEARLEREGYLAVSPETLPFRDQVYLFQQPHPVIAIFGSALHTALFRTHKARKPLGVLCGKTIKGRFLLPDAIKPVDTAFVNCLAPTDAPGSPGRLSSFRIDVERAMDLLSSVDLLGPR